MITFDQFFEALWKSHDWPKPEPFPWQRMLAERAAAGEWPEVIELPTASGKTACLDAAVYALACQAERPLEQRTAPRRIWFIVDRRIVVDEAFERAARLAEKLENASAGDLQVVTERLRSLSGSRHPLAVARLRGGVFSDDGWARRPSQPAIICSTVDQFGSRLLFRSYAHRDQTAPIYAGLAANDSLVLLDEAHCAVPFMQTLRAVSRFRGERWAETPLRTPFRFTILSATPPQDTPEALRFPLPRERDRALDHPLLQQRLTAAKPAQLAIAEPPKRPRKSDRPFVGAPVVDDPLVLDAALRAMDFVTLQNRRRVAIMVNRVATAQSIARQLQQDFVGNADIVLLTGRMRPLDRDDLLGAWAPHLRANHPLPAPRPIILVTTQCLEVGADFSFDALVTECASLDALRQRFGRLDRLGALRSSPAAILIRERDAKGKEADPVYGKALAETWRWLNRQTSLDFGVNALRLPDSAEELQLLLAPAEDAPVLLPVHLDYLSQTAPRPDPAPDVSLFLHGKAGAEPEVYVIWRGDLTPPEGRLAAVRGAWLDTVSLLPPVSAEALSVRLSQLLRWLTDADAADESADLEGAGEAVDETRAPTRPVSRFPFFLWRGRDGRDSEISADPRDIRPGDIVVLPTHAGMERLGQCGQLRGLGDDGLDLAEQGIRLTRGQAVLRLNPALWRQWAEMPQVQAMLALATSDEPDRESLHEALLRVSQLPLPQWLATLIADLGDNYRIEPHPGGGLILFGRRRLPTPGLQEEDPVADSDDLTSAGEGPVLLSEHTSHVLHTVRDFAARCLPSEVQSAFASGALCHDLGKLDPRFQLLLRNGDVAATEAWPPLAKSAQIPLTASRRRQIRRDSGLPDQFRHEFVSVQLAERFGLCDGENEQTRELALHLVASHHGYARPLAAVAEDPTPPDVDLSALGLDAALFSQERALSRPPARLDSGVAERYWRLTRRYGWWGLAFMEAVFRLGDWEASRRPQDNQLPAPVLRAGRPHVPARTTVRFPLDALDGANPLAYLAALGTLRLLTLAFPARDFRMAWEIRLGAWRPVIETPEMLSWDDALSALLAEGIRLEVMFPEHLLAASQSSSPKNKKGEASWKDKLRFPVAAYRRFCFETAASACYGNRTMADYAATWASEVSTEEAEKTILARRTRFDFTAGQQAFIGMLRELKQGATDERGRIVSPACEVADLRRALLDGWQYSSAAVSMRWDPQDEKRQYALQAVDPTNAGQNPPLGDRGANFLAVEALPLFPMAPDRRGSQPGFGRDEGGRFWRWVIWRPFLGLDAVRSLMALSDVMTAASRRERGIAVVFQSAIVQPSGRYRCFTPARSV